MLYRLLDVLKRADCVRRLLAAAALAEVLASFPFAAVTLINVSTLDTSGQAWDVEVVGGLAYVADGLSGLRIVDVSNPAILATHLLRASKRLFGIPDFRLYALGDGIREVCVRSPRRS